MHTEQEGPEGAPDLVLLHGGIGTGRYHWSKQIPGLSQRYRVHLPDLPGHGSSPMPPDGRYDREVLVSAVEQFLDELGPPVHVAGFSMGGHTALALAARRPDVFVSLTLIGVSHRDHEGLHRWRARFDPDRLAAEYPLWARALSRIHLPLGGPDAWRDVCLRDSSGRLEVDVDLQALAAVRCPVLLVRGDRDEAVQPEQYGDLRRVTDADEFVVPAGGHDVQLTRSRIVEPVLVEFLGRARAG